MQPFRAKRKIRATLHIFSLGNWRQFPNISNLFCSRCGSLDAQANLVEKQKRECPVASPIGLSAPGLQRLVLRSTPIWSVALSANSFLLGPLRER